MVSNYENKRKTLKLVIMKMKKTLIIQFFLIINLFLNAQEFYTIYQVKDTLTKYENAFEAFSKLNLYKIPISKFRQDSFLLNKSYELFNIGEYYKYVYKKRQKEELKSLKKDPYRKRSNIMFFLKCDHTSKILDSIMNDTILTKLYLDSANNYIFRLDSIEVYKYQYKTTEHKYITFHSILKTQRGYDTIRAYYDRYYKNSLNFYEPVLIALINMGDPEVLGKYDSVLTEKINNKTLTWNDYTHIHDFDVPFMYQTYARLLFYDEIVDGYQLNVFITDYNFPVIYYEVQDSVLKKIELKKDKNGNKKYKFVLPIEEIAKYFLGFVDYWEKKEGKPTIKYAQKKK